MRAKRVPDFVMPRASFAGLLVTMAACFFPHATRLPLWMSIFALVCMVYRLLIHWQRADFPSIWAKLLAAAIAIPLLVGEYGTLMAPDGGVAFLFVGYFLKLLEMHYRRDAMVMLLLSFFVIPMQFLYDTSLLATVWVIFCYFCILSTLISFHQNSTSVVNASAYKASVKLMAWSIPVTILLFLFFPRLPPFWQLPSTQSGQTIGLSDQLDMESLDALFSSGKVAFRADFGLYHPQMRDLYWRSLVMEGFDGQRWSVLNPPKSSRIRGRRQHSDAPDSKTRSAAEGEHAELIHYKIFLEPSFQQYLPVLSPVLEWGGIPASLSNSDVLQAHDPVIATTLYWADTQKDFLKSTATAAELDQNLRLPEQAAPRSRKEALRLFQKANRDPAQFVDALRSWINADEFSYTLKPPRLSGDTTDDFLFRTRAGYCSHYASATTVMLRSVGIPARVVGGYQGGEYQASANYWIIHQYDAHAWVEYYTAELGWQRFDPTAAISPTRIEYGMDALTTSLSSERFSVSRIDHWPIVSQLRRSMDYLNYQWIVRVVGYQQNARDQLVANLFGQFTVLSWLAVLLGGTIVAGALLYVYVLWREQGPRPDRLDAALLAALSTAERHFRPRNSGETVSAYCAAYAENRCANSKMLNEICDEYHRLRYQSGFQPAGVLQFKTAELQSDTLQRAFDGFMHNVKRFKQA
ncbi:Transglutaminase-like protein [gamma proteobacterium HdN1]|nr:Transglutaminase-like protein [gamma proteobacterium HdN1]